MKLAEIFVVIVLAFVFVGSAYAARGANADSLDMLGHQCAGPVSGTEAEETFRAFDAEARKIKCRDLGSWSFDIDVLPERLKSIFNSTAPFTPKDLEELEIELLKQADPTAYQYVLRLMRRANELVAKGQPNRASSLLRGFAGCVKAEGLTDLIIADKGPYKSPLGTVELPLFPGLTVKPGWPNSEVYIGNASLYAKGGPFEGLKEREVLKLDTTDRINHQGCITMCNTSVGSLQEKEARVELEEIFRMLAKGILQDQEESK